MLVSFLVIGGLVWFVNFESEDAQGTDVSGFITIDTIWDLAGSPYIVVDDVAVVSGVTLTIEPRVEVKFDGYYSILVEGNLSAIGNEKMRITITSNKATPMHNDWFSIVTNSSGHLDLRYCHISYGTYGIYLESSSNNLITNNTIFSNDYAGIFLISSSNNNSIIGNNVLSNDDYGIYLSSSNGNIITDNNVTNNDLGGISFESSSNNTVENNTCDSIRGFGIRLDYSFENNVIYNMVLSNRFGINLKSSSKNNITSNNVSNNDQGIKLRDSSNNNSIIGNNVLSNNLSIIISYSSSFNTITNNNVSNSDSGISLSRSYSNNLTNNTMIKNGIIISGNFLEHWNTHRIDTSNTVNGKPVIYWKNQTGGSIPLGAGQVILANCTNVNVKGQELIHCQVGIALGFSFNNFVTGNDLSWNNALGIYLFNSSENYIIGNNVSNNTNGIGLRISWNNNIIGNTLSSNIDGIYLDESSNNVFHHNHIMNNTGQIDLDDATCVNNRWDDGMGKGNYWSDYNGVDDGSGGRTAGDGVGDTEIPHPFIDQGDGYYQLDNYPLLKPVGNYTFLYEGWNLISIPLIQSDPNVGVILSPISGFYKTIQWYNSTDPNDPWKHNCTTKPQHLNDFDSIDHLIGFWIYITEPGGVILDYYGPQPGAPENIPLHTGWNMVGFPSLSSKNRTVGLNNLDFGIEVDAIWTFDAATQTWEEVGPGDEFKLGRGYWVHATQDCTWEVPL